ncbi:MAG TPA: hypothetical protein VKZ53_12930 [Candidatus Angelobacter sp.]|nr:hypothetical protein [Candidatus Angelobacter sp.]
MRDKLGEISGTRTSFSATFVRFGRKRAFKGPPIRTALFQNICDSAGKQMCDHIWFTLGLQLESLNLSPGDCIKFCARVTTYTKGYRGRNGFDQELSIDYRLSFPTNIKKLSGADGTTNADQPSLFDAGGA